ncbi:hypothetical protein CY34DRAFT_601693 [Suillus luteus UH-Slu-Lm8-n1]|uniref:Uncharacterized protein n=1 Tax=Suillus luteus UH-Slu-Lm8-n1 TaxID=930992 RepID=A0A0C9ZZX7_9AGAM|nr:hypothetical protein CY34DRAFT_601693 [Suillus luteus UH-Slu-Lm8-n1]
MLLLRPHTASDLADCNPIMRRQVVHDNDNNGLTGKRTRDFARQGREGRSCTLRSYHFTYPDGHRYVGQELLGEAPGPNSSSACWRAEYFSLPATRHPRKPPYSRYSRPLENIQYVLDTVLHIRRVLMDNISPASTSNILFRDWLTEHLEKDHVCWTICKWRN